MRDTISITSISSRFKNLMTLTPSEYIRTLINFMLGLAGVLAFISLIIGGLQWIISGGEKEGIDKAKKRIVSAMTGLAIVFSSYALLYIIRVLFNIDMIGFVIAPIGS